MNMSLITAGYGVIDYILKNKDITMSNSGYQGAN